MIELPRVLLVAHIGLPWGGPTQRYYDLIHSSISQHVRLDFFESSPNRKSFDDAGLINFRNVTGFLSMFARYIIRYFRFKPSIVHIAATFGNSFIKHSPLILAAKILGSKVILAPHCSITVFLPKSTIRLRYTKFILNRCDGMIIFSNEWESIRNLTRKPRLILLKNAINLSNYLQIGRQIKITNQRAKLLYLGHIGVDKGIIDLLHAMQILEQKGVNDFTLLIFGEDLHPGETKKAKELALNLQVNDLIHFNEPVFGDKKIDAYREADIFVFPSHHEGMPIAIIEAMAAGLPVIATKVGGIPDLVDHLRTGILVERDTPQALASAIENLLEDEDSRYQFGLEGRKKAVENHDMEKYVKQLSNYYHEIIAT